MAASAYDSTSRERTVPAKIRDFTPLFDALIEKYDLITAAVWGRLWRYSQKYGYSFATHETIAHELGIARSTVIRRLRILIADGYVEDLTPDLRNKPHQYQTTDKIMLLIELSAVSQSHSEVDSGVSERHTGVSERHSQCVTETHEYTNNKQSKRGGAPDGAATPRKKAPKNPEVSPLIQAISEVTLTDANMKTNYGRLAKTAGELHQAGYTAEQVISVFGPSGVWWSDDFRGRDKGSAPTPAQVASEIKRLLNGNGHRQEEPRKVYR